MSWIGRSSRKEYWLSIGLLVAVTAGLAVFFPELTSVSNGLTIAWILFWIRRLHDFGKSGWLVLWPLALTFAVVLGPIAFLGTQYLFAMVGDETALSDPSAPYGLYAIIALATAMLIHAAFTIWVGVKRGDAGPNRFGEVPGF